MAVNYEEHRRGQEIAYLLAYEEFEQSLTPQQRAALGTASAPDLDEHSRMQTGAAADVAESSRASYTPDLSEALDGPVEDLMEKFGMSGPLARAVAAWAEMRVEREAEERKSRTIIRIAGCFLATSNAKLASAGLAYASDLAVTSGMGSMREYAATIGVSVEAVSKSARWWRRELELPCGSHMKGEQHCQKLSEAQQHKHWRKVKYGNNGSGNGAHAGASNGSGDQGNGNGCGGGHGQMDANGAGVGRGSDLGGNAGDSDIV